MKSFRILVLSLVALVLGSYAEAAAAKKAPAPKAPAPALAQITDVPGLPRVLLIGDSISMGYTLPVRARFQGKANVHRPPENCGDTARGVKSIDKWLGDRPWDVIHFNFGLHDLKYLDAAGKYVPPDQGRQVASPAEYEKNLRTIVARLKTTGAKLIFATTSPVPAGTTGRVEHDERRYNEVAVRVMRELGVAIDDLDAFIRPRQEKIQRPNNVHFNEAGSEQLADAVVASIMPFLPAPRR